MVDASAVTAVCNASWADCLQAAGIHTRCDLISAAARDRVLQLGARIPALAGGGIECHLTDPNRADVAIRLSAEDGGREALRGHHPSLRFAPALTHSRVWSRLRQLAERWADRDSPLHTGLQTIWLEFDLPATDQVHVPSVFLGLRPVAATASRDLSWLTAAARVLCGEDLSDGLQAGLRAPVFSSTATGRLTFVGLMLARRAEAVRVVLGDLNRSQLVQQATMLGWPGDAARLAALLHELCPPDARLALHLDLATTTGPTLGIELALPGHPQHSPSWDRLLRGLIAERACTPHAATALAAWPGLDAIDSDAWQPPRGLALRGIARRINHLKLQLHPEQRLLAKAYLYCGLLPELPLRIRDSQGQEEPHAAQL